MCVYTYIYVYIHTYVCVRSLSLSIYIYIYINALSGGASSFYKQEPRYLCKLSCLS